MLPSQQSLISYTAMWLPQHTLPRVTMTSQARDPTARPVKVSVTVNTVRMSPDLWAPSFPPQRVLYLETERQNTERERSRKDPVNFWSDSSHSSTLPSSILLRKGHEVGLRGERTCGWFIPRKEDQKERGQN